MFFLLILVVRFTFHDILVLYLQLTEDGRTGVNLVAVTKRRDKKEEQKLEVEHVPHQLHPMEEQIVAGHLQTLKAADVVKDAENVVEQRLSRTFYIFKTSLISGNMNLTDRFSQKNPD